MPSRSRSQTPVRRRPASATRQSRGRSPNRKQSPAAERSSSRAQQRRSAKAAAAGGTRRATRGAATSGSETKTHKTHPPRGITLGALWRFGRPHTIIGTTVSIISVTACGVDALGDMVTAPALRAIGVAIVASLMMNVYIVGLNQMTDVAIDKVNKPFLPVASGELTVGEGWVLVASCVAGSFGLGWVAGTEPLLWTLFSSFILGTAYSLEPIRLKKHPFLAAFCILAVRGVIVQYGFYHHIHTALASAGLGSARDAAVLSGDFVAGYPRPLVVAVAFVTVFAIVIALFKDLPDVTGDEKHGVRTFSVRAGVENVFRFCVTLLVADYAMGAALGLMSTVAWSRWLTTGFHAAMAVLALARARQVDAKDQAQVTAYYMFVWKLFYAEYTVLPFVR